MLTEKNFKDIITAILVIGIFILAIFVLKPVIFSIIYGILLAYIFYPLYKIILKKIKKENLSAFLVCLLLLLIVLIPTFLILSSLINQIVKIYLNLQGENILIKFKEEIPSFLLSSEISKNFEGSINTFIAKIISYLIGKFSDFLLNLPIILLHLFVVIFVFFFSLRDGEKTINYVKSLSPLSKDVEDKFFMQFKDITNSVLLGQVVIGIIQGLAAGIGYFVFGVPYAIALTLLTILVAIIPFIGAWLVWVPVDFYLFMIGKNGAGLGLFIYGLVFISVIDNFMRPLIISRRTEINSAIVMIGMIGGFFVFGVLGIILGPLILGYVLLVIEIYRKKRSPESILFKEVKEDSSIKSIKKELLILKDSSR